MRPATLLVLSCLAVAPLAARAAEATAPARDQLLGSCRVGAVSCTDFEKGVGAGAKEACLKYKLVWSEAACPTEKRVGTCVKREGGGRSFTQSYPPSTADVARTACKNTPGGTFVP